MTTVLPTLS